MKRIALIAVALALAGCDPLANNLTGNVKVSVVTADNGVPCVLAVGGGQGGLAISCDWSGSRAPSVVVPR
ncbi:hypothetical protein K6Y74_01750 [Burkholderia cenocepacia]|uniref:Lipoprotein n=1 Tax=Burkholderia stabilis TaxID=95485 RepID=A0AAJ5N7U1_9BURK|nr:MULTISPECIES: hypothetical protein [Burkholderia cepacia complex]MCW3581737.1 hypothetical protein [Burkholderia cenocepacia]MCW3626689.1 hypothetical protein [Burkholderia cenocepacia]MCW3641942.1 hypothetical protein [Burkholderia cenocepacia]MCW5179777.1 hypothetical protein [Burkholderia cenocepacia]NGO96380.1 hypothetical protein [Burkholderia cenocepacia]